jgi:hypothetical protein
MFLPSPLQIIGMTDVVRSIIQLKDIDIKHGLP